MNHAVKQAEFRKKEGGGFELLINGEPLPASTSSDFNTPIRIETSRERMTVLYVPFVCDPDGFTFIDTRYSESEE